MKRMCWVPLLSVLLVFGIAVCCVGDQLQWNPLSVCVDAAERLAEATLWVSYCSLADGDFVELWLLRGFEILSTQATDLF